MMLRHVAAILAVGVFLVGVGACSSDDDGGGSTGCVCDNIPCGGSVSCNNGEDGTASIINGNCVLSNATGSATLRCDGTASAGDTSGSTEGTWSMQGSSVVMDLQGDMVICSFNSGSGSCSSGGEGG